MNVNKVTLGGNLTRDPETKHTHTGLAIVKFGVACNEFVGADKPARTTFVDVTMFGKRGEALAKYLSKGDPVLLLGRLDFSSWTDATGAKRSKLSVVADEFQFCGGKADKVSAPVDDDSIPF